MTWVFAIVVVLALGVIAAVASGRGEPMAAADSDRAPGLHLGSGEIDAATLRAVRFPTALRGYRADEVDALLERLAQQLEQASSAAAQPVAEEAHPTSVRPVFGVGDEPGAR